MNPWARKSIEALRRDAVSATGADLMPRAFGTFALTCVGVGSTIGAGIFVLTGTVAAQHTGPAVIVAFVLAGFACLMAGLCYAELASMIPVAGSAYSYTYATLGEGAAWLVGWCLVLEYLFSGSMVAIGWSGIANQRPKRLGTRVVVRNRGCLCCGVVDIAALVLEDAHEGAKRIQIRSIEM